MKFKCKEFQDGGSQNFVHRRSLSLFNNVVHNREVVFSSTLAQECRSEGRRVICHDKNSEASIIDRNKRRKWSHFDRESRSNFWKAMESLGLVHKGKEGEILVRLEKMEYQSLLRKRGVKEFQDSSL